MSIRGRGRGRSRYRRRGRGYRRGAPRRVSRRSRGRSTRGRVNNPPPPKIFFPPFQYKGRILSKWSQSKEENFTKMMVLEGNLKNDNVSSRLRINGVDFIFSFGEKSNFIVFGSSIIFYTMLWDIDFENGESRTKMIHFEDLENENPSCGDCVKWDDQHFVTAINTNLRFFSFDEHSSEETIKLDFSIEDVFGKTRIIRICKLSDDVLCCVAEKKYEVYLYSYRSRKTLRKLDVDLIVPQEEKFGVCYVCAERQLIVPSKLYPSTMYISTNIDDYFLLHVDYREGEGKVLKKLNDRSFLTNENTREGVIMLVSTDLIVRDDEEILVCCFSKRSYGIGTISVFNISSERLIREFDLDDEDIISSLLITERLFMVSVDPIEGNGGIRIYDDVVEERPKNKDVVSTKPLKIRFEKLGLFEDRRCFTCNSKYTASNSTEIFEQLVPASQPTNNKYNF